MLTDVAAMILLAVMLPGARAADAQPIRLPLGLDAAALVIPADNTITPEKVELGKQLFFDARWSRSKTVSCASCHAPEHGWADPRRFSLRADGKPTPRHAPTVINRAFSTAQHSLATLAAVVEYYDRGGTANPWRSPHIAPLALTEAERADLVAFLEALTGEIDAATLRRPSLPPDP